MSKENWVIRRGEHGTTGLFGLFGPFDSKEAAVDHLVENGIGDDRDYYVDVVRVEPVKDFAESIRVSQEDRLRIGQMISEGGEH